MIHDLLQVVISTSEQGLWWDTDPHWADPVSVEKKASPTEARGRTASVKSVFGITLKIRSGHICYPSNQKMFNNWQWIKYWKYVPLPFLSICFNNFGFYVGFKDFRADPSHSYFGVGDGERLLTPGFRFTSHRD